MSAELSPPEVEQAFQGICPYCRKGPYKALAIHVNQIHGLDQRRFKDELGVTYNTPLCSPEYSEMQREKSSRPKSVARMQANSKEAAKRKRRLSSAAKGERANRSREWWQVNRTSDPDHGTRLRYEREGCRCETCRAANAQRSRVTTTKRTGRQVEPKRAASHGTKQMYEVHRCRCDTCRSANAARQRLYRARRKARTA